MPLGRVARIAASNVDKKTDPDEVPVRLCNYTDVYYNEFINDDLDFMKASATLREIDAFRLRGGEVLLTKDSETAEDIAKPAFVRPGLDGVVCGYHLYVLRPRPEVMDGRFLMRACSVPPVSDQFVIGANGITRFGLGQQELASALIPVPPLSKQRAIAGFLDRETARIDDLIAQKERLLELLDEQRMAMITQAVTKGLDPDVEMKDSGVDWLESAPCHWHSVRIGRLFRQIKRQDYPDLTVLSVYRDLGVIEKESRDDNFNKTPLDLTSYQLVEPEDIVINKMKAWQGSLGVSDHLGITSPDYIVYEPKHNEVSRFLHYLLRAEPMPQVYRTISDGIRPSQWRLQPNNFEALQILLPPVEEQREIIAFLTEQLSLIDQQVPLVRRAITLLREYRGALISAAVTGKIDVREET